LSDEKNPIPMWVNRLVQSRGHGTMGIFLGYLI
jgi:hypothetical protein